MAKPPTLIVLQLPIIFALLVGGCTKPAAPPPWHKRVGWNAVDYFDDAKVVSLCGAIERDNLAEMERLIDSGANVNTVGRDGMTPLLWAFPDRKIERFACLLRHGADPNVYIESDFGTGLEPFHPYSMEETGGRVRGAYPDRGCHAGETVVHLACKSPVVRYLQLVMKYGGNPNLVDRSTGEDPLTLVLDRHIPDSRSRAKLLVAKGANLDRYCKYTQTTPVMRAVQQDNYSAALDLLKAGADPHRYQPDGLKKVTHFVLSAQRNLPFASKQREAELKALSNWLEANGESLAAAEAEQAEWQKEFDKALSPKQIAAARERWIDQRRRNPPHAP